MNFLLVIKNKLGEEQKIDFKDDLKKMLVVAKTFIEDNNYEVIIIPSSILKPISITKKKRQYKNYE